MVYDDITFGPSDDDDHGEEPKNVSINQSNRKIRDEGATVEGKDDNGDEDDENGDDNDLLEYTYGCVRRITDIDGEKRPCPGTVETTKDYGDRFYRECPCCEVEHPMEKVSVKNDDE